METNKQISLEEQVKYYKEEAETFYNAYKNLQKEYNEYYKYIETQKDLVIKILNNIFNERIHDFGKAGFYNIFWPRLNKNQHLEDYFEEGGGSWQKTKITKQIDLNEYEYEYLSKHLLTDFDFMDGTGGYEFDDNGKFLHNNCIIVSCNGEYKFIIDAEGYSYARYCGFLYECSKERVKTPEEIEREKEYYDAYYG